MLAVHRVIVGAVLAVLLLAILLAASSVAPQNAGSAPGGSATATAGLRAESSGAAAGFTSDVWQSTPAPAGFPGLYDPAVASDPVDHSIVVFGGCEQALCTVGTNATWTESNGTWTKLNTSVSPSPREEAQMAWDPADGYVLLFGGTGCRDPPSCGQTGALNDTWAFKDGTWNPVIASGVAPPPTDQGALAYDPSDRAMILFGGYGCTSSCGTWTYSSGTWSEPNLTTQPPARYGEGFSEDDSDQGALLFGGVSSGGTYLGDTWLFSDGGWHDETDAAAPANRADPAMAWDSDLGAVVLFGGEDISLGSLTVSTTSIFNDTWEFQDGTWSEWTGAVDPGSLWGAGFAEDPSTGLLLLVGGCGATSCPNAIPWGFGPSHVVSLTLGSGACGNATLAGVPISWGGVANLQNGSYPLRLDACSGYQIANVTSAPTLLLNLSSESASQWAGTVLVHGPGTIVVNLTHVASSSPPGGLAAISVLGLTFLELLLILVALGAVVGIFVAVQWTTRRKVRPPKVRSPPLHGSGPDGPPVRK